VVFDGHTHEQFVHLFHALGSDPDNRVVILTGSGDAFMESISPDGSTSSVRIGRHRARDARDGVSGQATLRGRHRARRRRQPALQEAIGTIRGRYFILTPDQLLPAREIAEGLAKLPPLTTRYTRIALTQKPRRIVDEGIGYGLALEGISAADVARARTP
jgi:hypothetical protein